MKITWVSEVLMLKPGISVYKGVPRLSRSWSDRSPGCESHTRVCREAVQMAVQSPPHWPGPSWMCFLQKMLPFPTTPPAINPRLQSRYGLCWRSGRSLVLGNAHGVLPNTRHGVTSGGKAGGSEGMVSLIWCVSPKHNTCPSHWGCPTQIS